MGNSDGRPEEEGLDHLEVEKERGEEWQKAEAFRKAEIFGRAAKFFRSVWDENDDPEAGWRYAHCLRKTGYLEVALGLLQELRKRFPDHEEIADELVWALYQGRLVPAKSEGNTYGVLEAAKEIVDAEAEGTALRLTVFAAIGAAKTKGHWRMISGWCELLDPSELSTQSKKVGQSNIPSDRERWYFAKIKALVNLQEWHLAAVIAGAGCEAFPGNINFLRWKANAYAGLGRTKEGLELLETLHPKAPWYVLADMAKYSLELEDVEGAWSFAIEAARAVGQDSAKVNLWELMARVSLALADSEGGLHHAGLMEAVRREQGWPLRPSHIELIDRVLEESGLSELPSRSSREWKTVCRSSWGKDPGKSLPSEATPTGESGQGKVVGYDPDRSFAFILPKGGGEQVFVLAQDIPKAARANGARVIYQAIHHFDKRKNRQSLRAVLVQTASNGSGA